MSNNWNRRRKEESKVFVPCTMLEWKRVTEMYNSDNVNDLEEMHVILSMWHARMGESCPVALTCTELLIGALLEKYRTYDRSMAYKKRNDLAFNLGMFTIRFVNYANEIGQSKTEYRVAISTAAMQMGIPDWIVKLRHDCSHVNIPPLSDLLRVLSFAREWLWKHFWVKPVNQALVDAGNKSLKGDEALEKAIRDREDRTCDVLRAYCRWRNNNGQDDFLMDKEKRPKELSDIAKYLSADSQEFIAVLIRKGGIIFEGLSDEEDLDAYLRWTFSFWGPVVNLIFESGCTLILLLKMIDHLNNRTDLNETSRKQLVAWVKMMVTGFAAEDVTVFSETDWSRTLSAIVSHRDDFDEQLVTLVMSKIPSLSAKRRGQIHRIMEISMSESMVVADDSMSVRTVSDLQEMIREDADDIERSSNGWTRCRAEDWRNLAIGLCPGQTYESLSLIVDVKDIEDKNRKMKSKKRRLSKLDMIVELDD